MPTDDRIEVYKQHRASQEKHIYFLLAAAGAAIGIVVNQTKDSSLSYSQIPLAVAVVPWGMSFYFGCRHLTSVEATLYANAGLLQVKAGEHPMVGTNLERMSIAIEGIGSAIDLHAKAAASHARWQFRSLIFGSLFYLGWHVYEMWLRGATVS